MLRLMIVDDERVIRETIFQLIDWESLGVEVIGLCKDGIEAYNMILDELPDIVMADIQMPGLSGLELVKKIYELDYTTKFIILTGYEEFAYAREAMKYGIRHYLLKPCNEEQIKESILEIKKECMEAQRIKSVENQHTSMMKTIRQDAMFHMILEGISLKQEEWQSFAETYAQYFDFAHQPYTVLYVYYLEPDRMESVLKKIRNVYGRDVFSDYIYGVYVKNTFILFGEIQNRNKELMDLFQMEEEVECQEAYYDNLLLLLKELIRKICRYDTIYVVRNERLVPIFNQRNQMQQVKKLCAQVGKVDCEEMTSVFEELLLITEKTDGTDAMRLLAENISMNLSMNNICSAVETAEFISQMNEKESVREIHELVKSFLELIHGRLRKRDSGFGPIAEQVVTYVHRHLSEPNLTLKRIAEEHLYMNVDYVGRQFQKATGKKFSQFLTEERIALAKELLLQDSTYKLQYLADRVGWGNNPQYFSQIFKKMEGITPAKWIQKMQQSVESE